ncbi:hypothetical protein LPJ73_001800 [Coemansia sp. RSA 2703]|nr:hypothetical protein LPJ73_001800 [Coemansia sp. RSA 2703]
MLTAPEDVAIDIDGARVRRVLRKLHARLGDIEADVAQRPSAYGGRAPRFTYSRRSGSASADGTRVQKAEAAPLVRSSSVGALSDGDDAAQDPAVWLATPRKRMRCGGAEAVPFAQRLEMLTAQRAAPAGGGRALGLRSLVVQLGESLWLGRTACAGGVRWRRLPLRILAAFRLGEALSHSSDLDYLDEMYAAVPPLLARFVLWQHVVALCWRRAPAYADALADALGSVGAFAQLDWLVMQRLGALRDVRALVDPAAVAPLHLRAADMGAGGRFVGAMVRLLAERRRQGGEDALWRLFVPSRVSRAARAVRRRIDSGSDTCLSSGPESDNDRSGDFGVARPARRVVRPDRPPKHAVAASRYAKWVARLGSAEQSTRVLGEALDHALAFLADRVAACVGASADEVVLAACTAPVADAAAMLPAVDAVRAICSLMFTRLGCRSEMVAGEGVPDGALRAVDSLSGFIAHMHTQSVRVDARHSAAVQGAVDACATYRFGLVLLALRHLAGSFDAADKDAEHVRMRLARVARSDLRRMCEAAPAEAPGSADAQLAALVLSTVVVPLAVAGAAPRLFVDVARLVGVSLRCARVALAMVDLVAARLDAICAHHRECAALQDGWAVLQAAWGGTLAEPPSAVTAAAAAPDDDAKAEPALAPAPDAAAVLAELTGLAADLQRRRREKSGCTQRPRASPSAAGCASALPAPAPAPPVQDDELGLALTQSRRRSRNTR